LRSKRNRWGGERHKKQFRKTKKTDKRQNESIGEIPDPMGGKGKKGQIESATKYNKGTLA